MMGTLLRLDIWVVVTDNSSCISRHDSYELGNHSKGVFKFFLQVNLPGWHGIWRSAEYHFE